MNRLKFAEQKKVCISIDVFKIYDGNDIGKTFEVLSTLRNKKLKLNNVLIEKHKDLLENRVIILEQPKKLTKLDMFLFD